MQIKSMRIKLTRLLEKFIVWKEEHLTHRQFVYILSFVVGILSGLAAVALKNTVHVVQYLLLHIHVSDKVNFLYLFFPFVGILLTILYVKYFVKDNIGHGISRVLFAISKKKGKLASHNNYSSLIGSTLTVGFGGSVGLEAPIVLTGSSLGSSLGQLFKLNYKTKIILIGCGAAGAIASIFKAPIAAVIFSLEVLMLDLTMWSLVPLLISAVTGLTISYFFLGRAEMFSFEMPYEFLMKNIPYYMLLGIITGFISLYFSRMNIWIESLFKQIKNQYTKWLIGSSMLGLLILFIPPLYGEGYHILNALLNGNETEILNGSLFAQHADSFCMVAAFFMLIVIFKVVATSVTTGAGGVGGVFAPTLFLGGISGYFFAKLFNLVSFVKVSDRNFTLLGMAGVMSGVMHAPLTAIFLIAEITGGYSLFIPLMITATISFITILYFEPHSIYHVQLAERKELITHHKDQAVLTLIDVQDVIEKDFVILEPDKRFNDLIDAITCSKRNIFPVVKNNMLIGVVQLEDIRHIMFNTELYESIHVRDVMYLPPAFIEPEEPMDEVINKFETTNSWNLPVISHGEYVGFLSKSKLFTVYRNKLMDITGDF
jgi:chloride channel protein, CIC family